MTTEPSPFEHLERAVLQIGWLGQRQFMQLLAQDRFGLTVPQFYTLMHLAHWEGNCKMSDLARATHQSAAALTGVIDRLLDKQLVVRERTSDDRRQVMVIITPPGTQLIQDIKQARSSAFQAACAELAAEEISMLLRLLEHVSDGMARQLNDHHEQS